MSADASQPKAALAVVGDAFRLALAPNRRNLLHWLSFAVTLAVVLSLTVILYGGQIYGWEQEIAREFQSWDYPAWAFWVTSSSLTDPMAWQGASIAVFAIVGLWLLRQRVEAALTILVFPLYFLGIFPKAIVERERPSELFEGIFGVGGGTAFPSGHTVFAVVFYGFLTYVALTHLRGRLQRAGVALLSLGFVILAGFGRIADGHHWPLDVLAAYVVSIGLLSALIWLHTGLCRARDLRATADATLPLPGG